MHLVVNGTEQEFAAPVSVAILLAATGFGQRRVAVEVNREVVPRSRHGEHWLSDGDRVEIIHALGGG